MLSAALGERLPGVRHCEVKRTGPLSRRKQGGTSGVAVCHSIKLLTASLPEIAEIPLIPCADLPCQL